MPGKQHAPGREADRKGLPAAWLLRAGLSVAPGYSQKAGLSFPLPLGLEPPFSSAGAPRGRHCLLLRLLLVPCGEDSCAALGLARCPLPLSITQQYLTACHLPHLPASGEAQPELLALCPDAQLGLVLWWRMLTPTLTWPALGTGPEPWIDGSGDC